MVKECRSCLIGECRSTCPNNEKSFIDGQKCRLFNNIGEGFAIYRILFDAHDKPYDYQFLEVNSAYETITGYSRDRVIGKTLREVIPQVEDYWLTAFSQAITEKRNVKIREYGADTAKYYDLIAFSPEPDILAILFIDITQQQRYEVALRESEARFRLLVETASDIILFVRPDGKIIEANRAAEQAYGYSRDELLGRNISDIRAPETAKDFSPLMGQENLIGTLFETMHLRKSGERFPVEVSSAGATLNDERVILSIVRDISERKRMEAELRNQKEWFEVTLQSIGDAVITTDIDGKVTFMNEVAEQLTAYPTNEAVGRPIGEVFHIVSEVTRKPADIPIAKVLAEGIIVGLANHTALLSRDGREYSIADSAAPIRDVTGIIIGVVMVFQDITEKKKAEDEFRRLANEHGEVFSGSASPLYLVAVSPNGEFHYCRVNPAVGAVTGIPIEQIIGMTPKELLGEIGGAEVEEQFRRCVVERKPVTFLADREMRTGRKLFQVKLSPFMEEGQVVRIIGITNDITDLNIMEKGLRDSEEKYRNLFEKAKDGITLHKLVKDGPTGKFIEVNDAYCDMLGLSRDKVLGLSPADFEGPEQMRHILIVREQLREMGTATFERVLLAKSGKTIPTEVTAHVFSLQGEDVILSIIRDISERKLAQETQKHRLEIETAVSQFSSLLISSLKVDFNNVVAILGGAVKASRSYMFSIHSQGEYLSKVAEWCAPGVESALSITQNRSSKVASWLLNRMRKQESVIIPDISHLPEEALELKDFYQTLKIKSMVCVPIVSPSSQELLGFLGFVDTQATRQWPKEDVMLLQSVTSIIGEYFDRLRSEDAMRYLSFHDKLTGVYNKFYFEEEYKRIDAGRLLPYSVIMGDVNGLKLVNDAFGHVEGDRVLEGIAGAIMSVCRQDNIVARWGGDEFVILLPGANEAVTEKVAARIKKACNVAGPGEFSVSISLGSSTKLLPGKDKESLLKEAEDRMYKAKLLDSQSVRSSIIASLKKTLWEKDFETEEHAHRMQEIAIRVGRAIGLSGSVIDELALLATLHDIGKVAIPEQILLKPGRLTDEEYETMKKHSEIGYRIALASVELAPIAQYILSHHEKWDGQGYPQGLKEEAIPLVSRIISVVDAYDAMTNYRPYKKDVASVPEALSEILRCSGSQFDPEIVSVFTRVIGNGTAYSDAAATKGK